MIEVLRRVFQRSSDVLILQVWVIAQDFRPIGTAGKHVENVGHADALAADAGPPAEHLRIRGDTINPARHDAIVPDLAELKTPRISKVTLSAAEAAR